MLTDRQLQIAQLVAQGQSNREIAASLDIKISTVDSHRTAIYRKLGVHNAVALTHALVQGRHIEPIAPPKRPRGRPPKA